MNDENLHPEEDVPGYVTVPDTQPDDAADDANVNDGTSDDAPEPPAPTFEEVATEMGWAPKEQWKGDPAKWKPAHEFVRTTADINSKLVNRLKGVEDTLSRINQTNQTMTERALAEQRQQILREREEAFDSGDKDAWRAAERKLSELPQVAPMQSPHVQQFSERNAAWFNKDQEATNWAVNRAEQLAQQGLSEPRQLATIERELVQYFPEYAPKEQPKPKPASLTQPGNRAATKRGKTFADLPAEAQKEAAYWEKKGVSRDDYVKTYFEQEGI